MTMDYKYIEQLLERYFDGVTSLEEEQILRAFFAQQDVPESLSSYKEMFADMAAVKAEEVLGEDFDSKILAALGEDQSHKHVKARIITMQRRLRPLYKAAACVAVVLALGQAAQMPYNEDAERQESIARSLEKPAIQQDRNAVAQGDTITNATKNVN